MNGPGVSIALPAGQDDQLAMLPSEFVELEAFRNTSVEQRLGYFGEQPLVIFGYCPSGGEVIWKDGKTSGFGGGGWKLLLRELVPAAACVGADLGNIDRVGTHVLWMDRRRHRLYAAPRHAAEVLLAQCYGIAPPHRRCLCAMLECEHCPLRGRGQCGQHRGGGEKSDPPAGTCARVSSPRGW